MESTERVLHQLNEQEQGHVHTLYVNNPTRLNVLNSATIDALLERLEHIANDQFARAVILRGSGDKAWIGGADIREIYREAKGIGFEPKIIRQLVKMRKMEASDRQEEEALIESYKAAIGMP